MSRGRRRGVLLVGMLLMLVTAGPGQAHPVTDAEASPQAVTDATLSAAGVADLSPGPLQPIDGLPSRDEAHWSDGPELGRAPFDTGHSLDSLDDADSLTAALRPQNRRPSRKNPSPAAGSSPAASSLLPQPAEDLALAIRQLQETLASEIADSLDVRKADDGRVNFSVAGVEGFHVSTGSRVSVGYADVSVDFGERFDKAVGALPGQGAALPMAGQPLPPQATATREIFAFLGEVIQYPLFWVLVLLLLAGKIGWLVFSYRERRRRRRVRSKQRPLHQAKGAHVRVRVRKRIRYRLGHAPPGGGIPEVPRS
ncbi:hypothetical protein [Accumulibacter sp.]|uniref:hypothetical protein n=1 Tax=Accumulibacter sp. TaxID=2053492 RepID=UPI0025FEAFEB|nr:hypothetical protein [Accumulibacter sp.]MCM8626891.1 hypothetical protein [Accumulibacter sp.]